jgi:DNA-binding FrmR family transcriptional regulator
MVQEGRDCSEVLTQLAAVRSALSNTAQIILKDHLAHCMVDAIESGDLSAIDNRNKAIEQFVKYKTVMLPTQSDGFFNSFNNSVIS